MAQDVFGVSVPGQQRAGSRSPAVAGFLAREHGQLIGGAWCAGTGNGRIEVVDPATATVIGSISAGTAQDADRAVAAARESFADGRWRLLPADRRSQILWRLAELMEAHAEELVPLEVLDNGMPMAFAQWELASSASWLRHFAGMTRTIHGLNASAAVSSAKQQLQAHTLAEPVGVAALIVPWNAPMGNMSIKLAPALAAGCSVVVKPAEDTSLTALRIGELALEAGVPEGVMNVVTGLGPTVGQALVDHPGVDKVSFTGSTETGKHIVRSAAGSLKRVTLELGGKSPVLVFDDADLEAAIPQVAMAIFANAGQVCFAGSRLFVQGESFGRVVEGIAEAARGMKLGSGLDPEVTLGPLVSARHRQRVGRFVEQGLQDGATLVTGGQFCGDAGFFMQPTVFANTQPDMAIVREEIFGPVLVATRVDDMEQMIRVANDTRYGLGAGVFTRDLSRAHEAARRLQAGNVWVNCYGVVHPTMPFGGMKESGWGREMAAEGLSAYLETKSVFMQIG